jgi:hypothetical protein
MPYLKLFSWHGASGSEYGIDVTGFPFMFIQEDIDYDNLQTNNYLEIPEEYDEFTYSYVKNFRIKLTTAIPVGNLLLDGAGVWFPPRDSSWIGVDVFAQTTASYVDPVANGTAPLNGFVNNVGLYNSNTSLLSMNVGTLDNTDTIGYYGDWLQVQIRVGKRANPRLTNPMSIVLNFDVLE